MNTTHIVRAFALALVLGGCEESLEYYEAPPLPEGMCEEVPWCVCDSYVRESGARTCYDQDCNRCSDGRFERGEGQFQVLLSAEPMECSTYVDAATWHDCYSLELNPWY